MRSPKLVTTAATLAQTGRSDDETVACSADCNIGVHEKVPCGAMCCLSIIALVHFAMMKFALFLELPCILEIASKVPYLESGFHVQIPCANNVCKYHVHIL